MAEKSLESMIDETVVAIEKLLCDQLTPAQVAIHEDIVDLNIYSVDPESQNEHSTNQAIEALARCRSVLEYGDKIIAPKVPVLLEYTIFGAN